MSHPRVRNGCTRNGDSDDALATVERALEGGPAARGHRHDCAGSVRRRLDALVAVERAVRELVTVPEANQTKSIVRHK